MPQYICRRCSKTYGTNGVFLKRVNHTSSGPFVAGHIGGDSDLPLVGVRLGESSYEAYHCKKCGEQVLIHYSKAEQEKIDKDHENEPYPLDLLLFWICVWVGAAIFIGVVIWGISQQ